MQQPSTRLRCDPTDYAKRQQEKKERAKDLRDQRQRGIFSEEHTFTPKVNPKSRVPVSASSREELDSAGTVPPRSMRRQPVGVASRGHGNNNHADTEDGSDTLDNLSRRYPRKASTMPQEDIMQPTPLEPEHDTLFREVKRATGREIEDMPIKRAAAPRPTGTHSGPCLRNSSCGCPKCTGVGVTASSSLSSGSTSEQPTRRREPRATPSRDAYQHESSPEQPMAMQREMGNSLALLKSKMSRRKSRSAPTNQASLFVEKNTPSPVVHSARVPTTVARNTPSPPPRQQVAPRRGAPVATQAPVPPARRKAPVQNDEEASDDTYYPPPISTGFNLSQELDEYADGNEEMEQCRNCKRKFNVTSFQKHQKVCEKVFTAQRKVFNTAAKRLEGTEAEKLAKEAKAKRGNGTGGRKGPLAATEQPIKTKNTADWKQKSELFRNAMKMSRDVSKAMKEGKELPPMQPSAPDPSLIQCEYCSRRFNDKAAERHINFCREKAQRESMNKKPVKRAGGSRSSARAPAARRK